MAQTGMQQLSIIKLLEKYNFIIPEIQREYVWGRNDYNIFSVFLDDIITNKKESVTQEAEYNAKLQQELIQLIQAGKMDEVMSRQQAVQRDLEELTGMNIGFLYSYRPDYYFHKDRDKDVFLIDGQQRFTTLFLALIYFSLKEGRFDEFKELMNFSFQRDEIAFDYRVRTLTHTFILELVENIVSVDDLVAVDDKIWFLSEYQDDISIQNMLNGFKLLHNKFKETEDEYYDFVLKKIKFWHFRTNETTQGEELYITMNSRGRSLADNETLLAKLLEKEQSSQLKRGADWEEWQDFFWRHRNKNEANSDAEVGFNEFLRWVQILSMVERNEIDTDLDEEYTSDKQSIIRVIKWNNSFQKLDYTYFDFEQINWYYKGLKYLYEELGKFHSEINSHYKNLRIPKNLYLEKDWLHKGKLDANDLYRLLPVLSYLKKVFKENKTVDSLTVFRFIRFFYNTHRIPNVGKSINPNTINAIKLVQRLSADHLDVTNFLDVEIKAKTILSNEEIQKLQLYRNSPNRTEVEDIIWLYENHPSNYGEVSHLLDLVHFSVLDSYKIYLNLIKFIPVNLKLDGFLRGCLLLTSVYSLETYSGEDRFYFKNGVDHRRLVRNKDFIKWINEKIEEESLTDFLENKFHTFFSEYDYDSLRAEVNARPQLITMFYILYKKDKWDWSLGHQIGMWYATKKRLFTVDEFTFQHFQKRFAYADHRVIQYLSVRKKDIKKLFED